MLPDISSCIRHDRYYLPWRTLSLTLLAILLYWLIGAIPDELVLNRDGIAQGEWWRMISGHWVHSDAQHAVWNITALLLLGALFEPVLKQRIWSDLLIASFLLSIWVMVYMPELAAYCGLSGILNTLLVSGSLTLWQQRRIITLLIIPVLAFFKSVVELYQHQAIFTHTAWPSVPEAHLVGMGIGLLLFFMHNRQQQTGKTDRLLLQDFDNS